VLSSAASDDDDDDDDDDVIITGRTCENVSCHTCYHMTVYTLQVE
jgi:hypothetical protein